MDGWQKFIKRFPTAHLLWSVENNARCGIDISGSLRAYALAGKVVIIHDYSNGNGWTVYVDPFTTLDIDETFTGIAKHCRLED